MQHQRWFSLCAALVLMTYGCSKDAADDKKCEPGESVECVCEDGKKGQQKCNDDGAASGECSCENSSTESNKPSKTSQKKGKKEQSKTKPERGDVRIEAPGLSSEGVGKAVDTVKLLHKLDELMTGFKPTLPDEADTSALQCVTTSAIKKDAELSGLSSYLKIQVKKSKKERKQIARKFKKKVLPLHHRIDHGWKSRLASQEPIKYLYSGTATPAMPELMKRIDTNSVKVPARLFCVVDDMYSKTRKKVGTVHRVTCVTGDNDEKYFAFDLTTDALDVQRGDLVSAPVGPDTALDKAVLVGGKSKWLLHAKTEAVKVEEKRTGCPDPKAELAKLGGADVTKIVAKQKKADRAARVKACYKRGPSRGVPWRYVKKECEKNPNRW